MSENVTSQEISKSQVEAAIQAVRDKGWDVNPYTVADEITVPHADISRNAEFMRLIVDARGGDIGFAQSGSEHAARIAELEAEVERLKNKSNHSSIPGLPGDDDDDALNEQVKALLSSESDEQLKHVEKELEQAYAQVVSLEEEKVDLTRSVTGLEKVNEALNARLRELEADAAALRKQAEAQPQGHDNSEMEAINREMALRLEELTASNRANNEHIALLESTNIQHESLILELEAKLAELQQEADMLALQLQNAFQVGYKKGLADSQGEGGHEEAAVANPAATAEQQADFAPAADPAEVATGDHGVYTPGQYYEMHQQMPNVEIRQQSAQAEPEPEAAQEGHVGGWGPEADKVLNFARTGPYVASNYNPLESLSWRDLETVYSMGVLSIKDFSRNLTDYAINADASADTAIQEAHQAQTAYEEQHEAYVEQQEHYAQATGQAAGFPETEAEDPGILSEPPKSDGALDFIDELIDIDKLDILDSLEELEELGTLDVGEPIKINFEELGESTGETAPVEAGNHEAAAAAPAAEELADLVKRNIAASKGERSDPQEVRTPPAPDGEVDPATNKPFPGMKKFVGQKAQSSGPPPAAATTASSTSNPALLTKHIPQDIRKNCMILGIRPEELTKEIVLREWKKQIASVHPDLQGGDTESSIYLNTAKDTLLRWLDQNTPKLGGKFGQKGGGSSPFTGKNKSDDKS